MASQRKFGFGDLVSADLVVDAAYEGGSHGDVRDDPLARLVGGGNQGGFRYLGSVNPFSIRHCVLYSDLADPDWPDRLDTETGVFTYYGDNKIPGSDLHATSRRGNILLREIFTQLHLGDRSIIPPIFVFTKGPNGREVVFRGIAAPGAPGVSQTEDLVAIWKTKTGKRFQNYRSVFTILDAPVVRRSWLEKVKSGIVSFEDAPAAWVKWREAGVYPALMAPQTKEYRSPTEQLPSNPADLRLLEDLVSHYDHHPDGRYGFERCATELLRLMQSNAHSMI